VPIRSRPSSEPGRGRAVIGLAPAPARAAPGGLASRLLLALACASLASAPAAADAPDRQPDAVVEPAAPAPEVIIEGLEPDLEQNVRAHLALDDEPCEAPAWRLRRLHARASAEIGRALRAFGHYAPRVRKELSLDPPCWRARFEVAPGPPVRVTRVDVQALGPAAADPAFGRLLGGLPMREGDVLHHGRYEALKRAIGSLAAERGYFDGRFVEHELRVDPERRAAEIRVTYQSGERYRFGRVDIEQEVLDAELVERFVALGPGDFYDAADVAALNAALNDSGYFSRVDVRPRIDRAEDGAVPVDVSLAARAQHGFSAGAGAATDTGPRGTLSYANRRVNRGGHRFSLSTTVSFIEANLGAEYRIPLADPRTEWLALQAGYLLEDSDPTESETLKLGVTRTRTRGAWLETQFLEALREDFTVADEEDTVTLLIPGLSWSRTVSDSPLRPSRGWRARLELRGSHDAIGSDAAFFQVRSAAKWVRRVPTGGRVLVRGDLGATLTGDVSLLPASQRFFAGGDNSVRGYGFRDLGPRNRLGQVIGGRYLVAGSIEYEHPLRERWGVAAFVDSGNALDDGELELKTGAGAGLRWHSPIGPVRLDLAFPLDDPDRVFRFHLSMGPDL